MNMLELAMMPGLGQAELRVGWCTIGARSCNSIDSECRLPPAKAVMVSPE